mgnify:CR=1 FL=1
MNKKFSTLVAVLLAAGAWTTLEAKVVEVTTPVSGSYFILGSGINDGTNDFTNALTQNEGESAWSVLQKANAETTTWCLTADGYLETKDGYRVCIDDTRGQNGQLKLVKTADAVISQGQDNYSVPFEFKAGKICVKGDASFSHNGRIKGQELNAADLKAAAVGTEFTFAIYASDSYSSNGLSSSDLTVDDNGKLIFAEDGIAPTYNDPVYFKTGNGEYLAVELKNGDYQIKKLDVEPTTEEVLSASWIWDNGKLYSLAARHAGKTVCLNYDKANDKYFLSTSGTSFTVADLVLAGGDASSSLYASAALPAGLDAWVSGGSGANIVDGLLKLQKSVPSGYAVVKIGDNYLKAGATTTTVPTISATTTEDYKNYLWKISSKTVNGAVYYTFTSLATGTDDKAIVWEVNGQSDLLANATYSEDGITLSVAAGSFIGENGNAGSNAAVIGFYEAFSLAKTQGELNKILNPGFDMTVSYKVNDKEVTIEDVDVFNGQTLYPVASSFDAVWVKLWNMEDQSDKDAKMLVLEKAETTGSDVAGAFKWISSKDYSKDPSKYINEFRFEYEVSDVNTISKLYVSGEGYVAILFNKDKYYLSTSLTPSEDLLPTIKLASDNIYDVKKLLGKLWNISYADTKANAAANREEYKLNGILAVTYDNVDKADYVASSTVVEGAPEAQWLVTSADLNDNTFTLTNRESGIEIENIQLREREGGKFEVYASGSILANDIVTITESKKTDNFQGYKNYTETDLRSNNFYLGQYHAILGNENAYFVENHNNSHKIGAVAEKEDADRWKLHFAMKQNEDTEKYTDVDTLYIINKYATLNAAGNGWENEDKKIKKDTLAIMPYTFQKVSNREFVNFDGRQNFEYYYCDPYNKDNSKDNYTVATRFALKVKPNGYNFVEINGRGTNASLSDSKVYLANSAENGSLERLHTYAPDNNSIMVVEEAYASEYHKIAATWGDTIKLFREENDAQVLYEKKEAKAVVANDTLSFLNIDNEYQFDVNPAIFADTAYINRWDNGVLNTTYQYLLAVNVDPTKSYYCPYNPTHNTDEWREENGGPCADAKENRAVYGRFLVNLIDTANVYGVNHIHNNWYVNEDEAGEFKAKLAFVDGVHTNDTLYLTRQGGETVKVAMDTPDFNVAKFAFRYVDADKKTFKIQTQYKAYLGYDKQYETAEDFAEAYEDNENLVSNEGYLKWVNGTLVVVEGYEKGDVFGIEENYEGDPTANESINAANSNIVVAGVDGAVIVKGAEGKNVIVSTILGKVVANEVVSSDNATIAAPAGIVVVSVDGESFKVVVK